VKDQTTATFTSFDQHGGGSWTLIISVGEASSRVVPLADRAELVIGRHPECTVVIDHDGVSRRHVKIVRFQDHVTVEDLGSRNGTLVNGTKISGSRRLGPGDVIAIGPATAMLATSTAARSERYVATVGELEDRLAIEVDRATRYHRPIAVVMMRVEGPLESVLAHIDAMLANLRRMDLIAEYGADELAIVLPETDAAAAAAVAQRACQPPSGVIAIAGVATYPDDGAHGGDLISAARARMTKKPAKKRARPTAPDGLGDDIIAIDPLTKHVFELAGRTAASSITVLVTGETGVGKEVVASAIHRLGKRTGPLVTLNCASLPESLVESELFGHEKGAFTGAVSGKQGYFEVASTGTLFLDEIGELPLAAQAKVLRAIEQRKVVHVGGTKELPVDVRLVCATNRDLEAEVERGRFRADLYFRISAFVIPIPPLRDRRIEIQPLAMRFVRELSSDSERAPAIDPAAAAALEAYDWPGNVRELRNVIERALVLSGGAAIELDHLPDRMRPAHAGAKHAYDVRQRIADIERDVVANALQAASGNQTHAARALGISRFALIRLLEKHDLKPRPR
jgi:DNA-binding NtrC family response regulator